MGLYTDIQEQNDLNNLITCVNGTNIHDGEKRYGTREKSISSSNYPKPKTMFYVYFDCKGELSEYSFDLSKYVIDVSKPSVTVNTVKMNQYNRIRHVVENVDYGDLKITFMDVKDDVIEQAFFKYLKKICLDFNNKTFGNEEKENTFQTKGSYDLESMHWGVTTKSNERLIKSITIVEPFINKMMAYTVQNPLLTNISFGDNKIGDYSPNQITLTFKVEGLTDELILDGKSEGQANGAYITKDIAHRVQKRWNDDSIVEYPQRYKILSETPTPDYQVEKSDTQLAFKQQEKSLKDSIEKALDNYTNNPHSDNYWLSDVTSASTWGYEIPKAETINRSRVWK